MRWVLRSKIHMATVTEANPEYVGSITIDADLMQRVGLWPDEKVLVASKTTGARLETYAIPGKPGGGDICMNGPAAHSIGSGEQIVIMGFELTDKPIEPTLILVDDKNRFIEYLGETPKQLG
jgi:aspartate 1-decarboxylase